MPATTTTTTTTTIGSQRQQQGRRPVSRRKKLLLSCACGGGFVYYFLCVSHYRMPQPPLVLHSKRSRRSNDTRKNVATEKSTSTLHDKSLENDHNDHNDPIIIINNNNDPIINHDDDDVSLYHDFCENSGRCEAIDIRALDDNDPEQLDVIKSKLRHKHLRIRMLKVFLDGCGFFIFPLMVLNQLLYAQQHGLLSHDNMMPPPLVYMPESHHYYSKSTLNHSDFWERWFEPISQWPDKNNTSVSWRDVPEENVWEFTQASIQRMHYHPNLIRTYPYSRQDVGTRDWMQLQRDRAHSVVKYLRVQPQWRNEARASYEHLFGPSSSSAVLGLHMRGTDKHIQPKVDPNKYLTEVNRYLEQHPDAGLFLATDDPGYLQLIQDTYPDRVHTIDVTRQSGNVLYNDTLNPDHKSHEVLMDMLHLSMTTALIKPWSAVSEFALYVRRAHESREDYESIIDMEMVS